VSGGETRRGESGGDPALRHWELAGLLALAVIVATVPLSLLRSRPAAEAPEAGRATFVGSAACRDCHQQIYDRWQGSDHDLAMAEATEESVRGDFDEAEFTHRGVTSRFYRRDGKFYVRTEGPGGEMGEFEIAYTFGFEPLQQYLVPLPGGRLQALSLAWDVEREVWFHLYPDQDIPPDDWLHWTLNGQNWNVMCAECHSTNLKKGYDPATESYATTWSDIDVGCEACHGPGSRHVAWAKVPPMARPELADAALAVSTSNIAPDALVELCAPCHSRRAEVGDYDHTGPELLDHMLPSLLREGEDDAADLLVSYEAVAVPTLDMGAVRQDLPGGASWVVDGPMRSYYDGTLVVTLSDAETGKPIWSGWTTRQLEGDEKHPVVDEEKLEKIVRKVTKKIMTRFPPRK